MINYTMASGHRGIYTIVSHSMLRILTRSGWNITVVERGVSEKVQDIYLVYLPTDAANQRLLIERINQDQPFDEEALQSWPMVLKSADALNLQSV